MKAVALTGIAAVLLAVGALTPINYPEGKITIKVIDDESKPVEASDVAVGFQVMSKKYFGNEEIEVRGPSNADGEFTGSAKGDSSLAFTVRKAGYYQTTGKYDFKEAVADKWQPWNPTVEVVLKKIEKPIAMYAKKLDLAMPAFEVPVGFDLVIGDWVAPHGKGKTRDLVFTAHLQQRSKKDYDYELAVTFSNVADGLQPFEAPPFYGSELKSPRLAPENGYLPEWKQWRKRAPGKAETSNVSESRNYLLRVRTVVDEKGELVSALYGKIYGDFLRFAYYLNSTANDRNLEFDPTRSLYKGLSETERVEGP
jgi:hypothetical protein